HLVVCINKMDLVDYAENAYQQIRQEFELFSAKLDVRDVHFIPVSALKGDNIVNRSENMPWYQGATLLYYLENVHIGSDENLIDPRFPVQYVIRPLTDAHHDYRGYAGRVASGSFRKGDEVHLLPSGFTTRIRRIDTYDGELEEAVPPMSVTLLLEDDFDLGRGDMIVREHNKPEITQDVEVMICWFSERPLQLNGKYILKHTGSEVRCMVKEIRYKLDINTLSRNQHDLHIGMNDIARVLLRTTRPLFTDSYRKNRTTGSLIIIDETTNETAGAGMII
ncbi:MAG: sulfate adenylyltransferase subunit 1, partial [Bacteroidota bacterium]